MTPGPARSTPAVGQGARSGGSPTGEASDGEAAPQGGHAPVWFERLVLVVVATVCSVGLVGLVLALVGVYRTWAALLVGLPLAAACVAAVWRTPGPATPGGASGPGRRHAGPAAAVAVVVAVGFTAWASWAPSHHVLINRDPGSYTATARWLARDGDLSPQVRADGLDDEQLLRTDGFAVYDVGDGSVEFQFTHLSAVVLAAAYDLGGSGLMFRVPAMAVGLGLLALYAVALRCTRRPWVSLVAPLGAAACMPLLFVARDTYSESLAFMAVWAATLAGLRAADADEPGGWAVAGLLAGAAVALRPDTLLVAVAVGPLLVLHLLAAAGSARVRRARALGAFLAAAALAGGLGLVDLLLASGDYAGSHGGDVLLAGMLAALSTGATALAVPAWRRWVPDAEASARRRRSLATPAALVAVAAMLLAWFVRPRVQTMTGADPVDLVGALQRIEGVAVEPARRYGERSVQWLSWYLGPAGLGVAIAGLGLAVHRIVAGRATRAAVLVTSMFVVVGSATLWRPSIVPDQVWAMRRAVPVVLPSLLVLGAVAVAWLLDAPVRHAVTRRALAAAAAFVLVLGPLWVSWPVRSLREQHGALDVLEQACDLIGPDASVVVLGRPDADVLTQPIRSWCGVPAAAVRDGVGATDLEAVASSVRRAGRTLVLVSSDPAALTPVGRPVSTGTVIETRQAERTLLRAPQRYATPDDGWSLAVVRVGE